MDFDRRGKEWTKRLTQYLEQTNVRPNVFFWQELYNLISHDIKDIEGLLPYLQTLKKKSGDSGELSIDLKGCKKSVDG